MPDHISSSEIAFQTGRLDTGRLKAFMRSVAASQKKIKEKEIARQNLRKHIEKLQKIAVKKYPSQVNLRENLAEVENKVNDVIQKEAKLYRTSLYEEKTVSELRKRVAELEKQLAVKDAEKQNMIRFNRENIKDMADTIGQLKQRMGSYLDSKAERDRKMAELEDRIKRQVETKAAGERMEELEMKFRELEMREGYGEEDLLRVKQRIDQLKTRM
jgi:chromosome segregation ATPase